MSKKQEHNLREEIDKEKEEEYFGEWQKFFETLVWA